MLSHELHVTIWISFLVLAVVSGPRLYAATGGGWSPRALLWGEILYFGLVLNFAAWTAGHFGIFG
jgi:hypothetical protein